MKRSIANQTVITQKSDKNNWKMTKGSYTNIDYEQSYGAITDAANARTVSR